MPGHMMAAINAYPFLTCNGENKWGELFTKPICPCNETTFEFAENVFSEIMEIFPSNISTLAAMKLTVLTGVNLKPARL
jgi:hexosaminidase